MDRRQKKTREAIFKAFIGLLSKKHFNQITVGEIIEKADIGRATFYAHFATKDFLLKELCEELFCHLFDCVEQSEKRHKHIFDCNERGAVVLHLLQHLQKNDNGILDLLSCENNELFLRYFKENLLDLIQKQSHLFASKKSEKLPRAFWVHHVASTFIQTVRWWVDGGIQEPPERIYEYFLAVL